MGAFDEPATYHSGENNQTTGREPFEDTSRDFIHGGNNTHAPGTGIPGTFGAGVGNTTSTTHHTGGLTGAATGAGLTGHGKSHGLNRRGSASSSSSSSSEEEVDGVRRKKLTRTKNKKPIGEKVKEAVGMGGAGAGVAGTHGKHESAHGSHIESSHTTGVSGVTQQGSHGLGNLHGQRDTYNEGGLAGARQTGDIPGGVQSGNTHFGTGHNLAADDRSAGYARDSGLPGNQGVAGSNLAGAAGTDRFDVDRSSSGVNTGYGHDDAHKYQDSGVSRHGITGDFANSATSTGGAYDNPNAKTGLTGREHTTTGVPDQHGNATHTGTGEAHSGGLLDKVKGMLGGHSK